MNTYLLTATYWPKVYLYWPGNYFPAAAVTGAIDVTLRTRSLAVTLVAK